MRLGQKIFGISLIAMSIGLVGCGNMSSTTSELPQNRNRTQQIGRNMITGRYEATKRGSVRNSIMGSERGELLNSDNSYNDNSYNKSYNQNTNLDRMEKIQRELRRLTGDNNSTCVVDGNTAIVGCPKDARYSKREITNVVKRCDPSIEKCEVVTTNDGVSRINKMAEDIRKGNIGKTMSQDFKKMWDDIVGY